MSTTPPVLDIAGILEDMQKGLYARARTSRDANTRVIDPP